MDLTPYASPRRTMAGYITPTNLRYGMNIARTVSPYARQAAANVIGRGFRAYSARKRRKYTRPERPGHPVGKDTAKTTAQTTNNVIEMDSRLVYASEITAIDKDSGGSLNINKRMRQIVHLRGYAWNIQIRNNDNIAPMTVNIAIVSMKKSDNLTISFRDYLASRDVNFSSSLSNQQLHNLPISTDRLNVYMHKRFLIGRGPGNKKFNASNGPNYKMLKGYLKINRQMRFDDDGTDLCETPMYFVHWFDRFLATPGAAAVPEIASWNNRGVTYFSESTTNY